MNNGQTNKVTILYERLSQEDSRQDMSLSIENQMQILETYAKQNGFEPYMHLADDGYSGTQWDRPGWQELITLVENDEVSAILIKNLDRMGRDYLRTGLYREMFKERGVRLIAVNDGIDTFDLEDDFTPFREIMAEFYARDASKKVKAVMNAKGRSGKPLGAPCYGYMKDPNDKNKWLVDPIASEIVKRIFQMSVDGMGPYEIAHRLSYEEIERPSYYFGSHDMGRFQNTYNETSPYTWNACSVVGILSHYEYLGHTVNFKTERPSYKSKKLKLNSAEKWVIFENTHEALVDQATWDLVQKLRETVRRTDTIGVANPLTGLLYCGQCGQKMFNARSRNVKPIVRADGSVYQPPSRDAYTCSTYKRGYDKFKRECVSNQIQSYIIRDIILDTIRRTASYVRDNESTFIERVRESSALRQGETLKTHRRQIAKNEKRITDLDTLYRKTYEDYATELLPRERFETLSKGYETEQSELKTQNLELRAEVDAFEQDSMKADKFIEIVRRYTDFAELTTPMLNEFISKVVVGVADKSNGRHCRDIDVYLNYIGKFDVPSEPELLTPEEIAERDKKERRRQNMRRYQRDYYQRKKAAQAA